MDHAAEDYTGIKKGGPKSAKKAAPKLAAEPGPKSARKTGPKSAEKKGPKSSKQATAASGDALPSTSKEDNTPDIGIQRPHISFPRTDSSLSTDESITLNASTTKKTTNSKQRKKCQSTLKCLKKVKQSKKRIVQTPFNCGGSAKQKKTINSRKRNSDKISGRSLNSADGGNEICKCGEIAYKLTVKKDCPNKGRQFHRCATDRCGFFLWADTIASDNKSNKKRKKSSPMISSSLHSASISRRCPTNTKNKPVFCKCGQPANRCVVRIDSPNKGKPFYGCPAPKGQRCGFFKWADEDSSPGNVHKKDKDYAEIKKGPKSAKKATPKSAAKPGPKSARKTGPKSAEKKGPKSSKRTIAASGDAMPSTSKENVTLGKGKQPVLSDSTSRPDKSCFKKSVDDTMSESVLKMHTETMKSIGALVVGPSETGTVFRVGSEYVMTTWHTVQKIIDPFRSGVRKWENLRRPEVIIHFNYPYREQQSEFNIQNVEYFNEALDTAVLKLSHPHNVLVAPRLKLNGCEIPFNNLSVDIYGYGHPKSPFKNVDPNCSVVQPDLSIDAAQMWLNHNKADVASHLKTTLYPSIIDRGYEGRDRPDKLLFHCLLEHGSSGAPILTQRVYFTDPEVIGIVTNGLPHFFWELSQDAQQRYPKEHRFEMGTRMSYIYKNMKGTHSALADDLF